MEGFENQDGYQSQTDYYSYGQTDNDNTNKYGGQSYYLSLIHIFQNIRKNALTDVSIY